MRYDERAPYYYDALSWYRKNVDRVSQDRFPLLGYIATLALEHGNGNFEGVGSLFVFQAKGGKIPAGIPDTLHKKGFVVIMPVVALDVELKPKAVAS